MSAGRVAFLFVSLCVRAAPLVATPTDILDRLIAPVPREEFLNVSYQRRWRYFPHEGPPIVPISLAHVSDWFAPNGGAAGQDVVEMLDHPVTGQAFRPTPKRTAPLQRVQDAFLQGFSMVINTLHTWSEPGARLANELYNAADLPIDVYMYLTPPHSKSYGLHCDVMDAWMVQLDGRKSWKICDKRVHNNPISDEKTLNTTCSEVDMRGGDVMYLPFSTFHKATTSDEFSMHLTVNVERQYYVWATLLIAVFCKVSQPSLTVEQLISSGAFVMEGETPLERFLMNLMNSLPRLVMLPAAESNPVEASRLLVRPTSREDLPEGYLTLVSDEFLSIAAEVVSAIESSPRLKQQPLHVLRRQLRGEDLAGLLKGKDAVACIPWVLEVARFHAVHHFIKSSSDKLLPAHNIFPSLAAARSQADAASELSKTAKSSFKERLRRALTSRSRLARRKDVRVVILLEDRASKASDQVVVQINNNAVKVDAAHLPVAQYALGLFGPGTARGEPFTPADAPGDVKDAIKILLLLITRGAIEILPAGTPSSTRWKNADAPSASAGGEEL